MSQLSNWEFGDHQADVRLIAGLPRVVWVNGDIFPPPAPCAVTLAGRGQV